MKITKDFFEKHLKKHNTLTVYSQENIPLTISKEPHIAYDRVGGMQFEPDCADLADYCNMLGLTTHPNTQN